MELAKKFSKFFSRVIRDHRAQFLSLVFAFVAAPAVDSIEVLKALGLLVFFDTATRIAANIKTKQPVCFKEFIYGIIIKVIGFSILFVIAEESTVFIEGSLGTYIKSIIYFFVPLTEITSIIRNLVDCGLEQLRPLLKESEKKLEETSMCAKNEYRE